MKYLVTGGAGFIGHNVVRFLENLGHECIVVDTNTGYGFIPQSEINYLTQARMKRFKSEVYDIDIRSAGLLDSLFEVHQPDVVIHMASFPRQKVVEQDPAVASEVMSTGLINLLELGKKHLIKKFVYISSSMVYGDFTADVTEETVCSPIGQYGIMKYMGEKLVEDYSRRGCFEHAIIRPSAVYGEWDVEDRVVSKFMTKAMRGETLKVNGPDEVLDFTYVEDTAMGIVLAATKDKANGNIYNITRSDTKMWSLKEAAELAIKIAGQGDLISAGRDLSFPKRGRLDISSAVNDLGYTPKVSVEEGFQRYYNWYLANPTLWKKNDTVH
jgi:nucleoside-diphosphate-sugar epimerase